MRKTDFYLSLKKYDTNVTILNGARAMANWYAMEGNSAEQEKIEMVLLLAINNNGVVNGQTIGRLKAYTKRFNELVSAYEVLA